MNLMRRFATALGLLLCLYGGPALATTLTGHIAVSNASTSADLGFVANSFAIFGEYGKTNDVTQSLAVSFSDSSAPFSIATTNGDPTFPYLGGAIGFWSGTNDLGISDNHAFLAGTALGTTTGQSSYAVASGVNKLSQSVLWSLGAGNLLSAHWVNSNSSIVAATIVYYPLDGVFVLVGNVAAFSASFGTATPVNFTFVPTVPVPAALPLFATGLGAVALLRWRRKNA
jgi:hypothetical protein